jgi:ABC-2 type transport system permease protein
MTASAAGSQGASAGPQTGSIYDIGYRKYEGPRLGRGHAIRSMFAHSLRSAFGIGRGGRAKLAPVILGFLACIPAVSIVAAQALLSQVPGAEGLDDELPIRYETYASSIGILIVLFCAAQAPDLFGRDQRHTLLSLYFSRALRREDYALARLGGFMVAVFIVQLLPQFLLFLGQVLLATDVVKGVTDDLPELGAAAAQAAITAGLLGGLSMAVSTFTPRRAYAVAGIIALFVIPNIVAEIAVGIGSVDIGRWLVLLSPTSVLEGTNAILFAEGVTIQRIDLAIPPLAYAVAAAAGILGSIVVTVRRLQGISA